jgi:hypothetical protein
VFMRAWDVTLVPVSSLSRKDQFARNMKRRTAHRLLFGGIVFCVGILLYCGSALRPFFVSPGFTTEANVPSDAIPAVRRIQTSFRMGQRLKFSFPAYLEVLRSPSKHTVRNVVTRYPMEDAVLIQDLNTEVEVALLNLGDAPARNWVQGASGTGLNTTYFKGKVIGEQGGAPNP